MNEVKKMRYIFTFIWTFALVHMAVYVTSAMVEGGKYDFNTASILAVIVTVLVWIVAAIIPNEPTPESGH